LTINNYIVLESKLIERKAFIINPLIDPRANLEKISNMVVYNPRIQYYQEVISKTYSFPVYLPELGFLLSLDMTSINLAREFYDETREYEGIMSKGKIFLCKMHNYREEWNRFVSWGSIEPINLSDSVFKLYRASLINDFHLSPSLIIETRVENVVVSPHRWFRISSTTTDMYTFEAIVNYNFGVFYLEKEKLSRGSVREKKVWLIVKLNYMRLMQDT